MFPAINVSTVKLSECRRVVLFNFIRRDMSQVSSDKKKHVGDDDDLEDEEVEIRHYAIRAKPVGVDRKVRRLVEAKIPNLSKLSDISDYITGQTSSGAPAPGVLRPGEMSDSEPEDEDTQVVLPGKYRGKGNNQAQKSSLKLVELGPRLRIKLYKVERGMASGDVMYHAYENKTPEEIKKLKQRKEGEAALKKRRRDEQEGNVARKQAAKDEKLAAKKARKKEREEKAMAALRGEVANDDAADQEESSSEEEEEQGTDSESFEEKSGDEGDSEAGMESDED